MPSSPNKNTKRKRGGRGGGRTAKTKKANACSQCSNCTGGKKAPRKKKSNVAATAAAESGRTRDRDDIDFESLPRVVRRAIERVRKLKAYNATAKHPDTGETYYLHREFFEDAIDLMAQLNENTIQVVLAILKCPTMGSVHSVCGKGSFNNRDEMDKCASAVAFGAISDALSRMKRNVDYGNHCALFGYNSRLLCLLQEGLRYCMDWTGEDAEARIPVILEIVKLCDHFEIPCLHLNFCGPNQASSKPMELINAYKSPYFIVAGNEASTHLATLTAYYSAFRGNQKVSVTTKVVNMDYPVSQFERLVHLRLLSLGHASELPTTSFSQCLMDNPKIKYVVEDVEEEARQKAVENAAGAAEKEARYEQEMENLNVEYAAISTNIMKGSVPPKPKNFSW